MRVTGALVALSVVAGLDGASAMARHGQAGVPAINATVAASKRFIVEFADGASHDTVVADLEARPGTRVLKTFRSNVFAGASVETTEDNIDSLRALGTHAVSQVWSSKIMRLGKSLAAQSFSSDAAAANYSVHNSTGVDKLHALGYYGKGAVVAIIDTGTQYTHPALGGGFGPGFKVAGGYDFVGDSDWPNAGYEKVPDDDPMDVLGHGTHVAGIIGGKTDQFIGVAPEATLLSYKVFGSIDGTDEDTLIEAFLTAYDAGADIITSSIGGDGGWADDAWAAVASRLVEQGVVVTIAAGNNGQEGPFFGNNGGSGEYVLAVASTEASTLVAPPFLATFTLNGTANTTRVAYYPGTDAFPASVVGMPIVPLMQNTSVASDACSPLPADTTHNLSAVVTLVRRGDCHFYEQQDNLEAVGSRYVLIYQDDEAVTVPATFSQNSLLALVDKAAGEAMVATVRAGGRVTADFSLDAKTNYVGIFNAAGGVPSDFTSFAATYDLQLKPEIAAPGGDIFSTYPTNGWRVESGTSMATPYVAGVAALYIGAFGGRLQHGGSSSSSDFAKNLAMRIMSSGGSVPWTDGVTSNDYGFWAPSIQVGTGLVDAYKVLTANTSLSYAKFNLNDTHHFERYHAVDITNHGPVPVTYRFLLQDAGAFEAWQPLDDNYYGSPRIKVLGELSPPIKIAPNVTFPSGPFTVQPGETKKAQINFDPPQTSYSNIPVYSGKVLIVGSNGDVLSVPYFGLASNLERDMKKQFQDGFPYAHSGPDYPYPDVDAHSAFTFNLSIDVQDYPHLGSRIHWGTRELRWDIFESGWNERQWKYPPVVGENGFVGAVAYFTNSGNQWYFDPAVDNFTATTAFPLTDQYRSAMDVDDSQFWWLGRLGNGSNIVPGNYTWRFAALAPMGNPTHSDNWDVYSHAFSVGST